MSAANPSPQPAPIVRVAVFDEFKFDDGAVLVAMNDSGLDALFAAAHRARERGWARMDCGGRHHVLHMRPGTAEVRLRDDRDDDVQWWLDPLVMAEMVNMLAHMRGKGLCHNYIDLIAPVDTLVLSVDEYLVPNAVVHTSPFGYF